MGTASHSTPAAGSSHPSMRVSLPAPVRAHVACVPAFVAVALMILWAEHDGGYDADTWYWGGLVTLGMLAVLVGGLGSESLRLSRGQKAALVLLTLFVLWSYLSISWAQSPGDALTGSNRTFVYLLVFALFALSPWTPRLATGALLMYTLGVGAIAVVVLISMATGHHVMSMFSQGRLVSPTGYFNSTAALFTSMAFLAVTLAARKSLPALLRGLLLALACGGIQLALLAESRGWLFILPLMLIGAILLVRDRMRVSAAAIVPTVAALVTLPRLLDVFRAAEAAHPSQRALLRAASQGGRTSLLVCAAAMGVGLLLAGADIRSRGNRLSGRRRRQLGTATALLALVLATAGALAATRGDPIPFVKRQWSGFTHPASYQDSTSSHFAVVGSARYDAWRVSLNAVAAHPLGGLGQDNFADYYVLYRRTGEELRSSHSLEMSLLAETGLVGFILFAGFALAASTAALRGRRRGSEHSRAAAGAALLVPAVWLLHGSIDWFWEMPALSAPALGFLAMGGALRAPGATEIQAPSSSRRSIQRTLLGAAGVLGMLCATIVLTFPYLSVREVSVADDVRARNAEQALRDLATAADLNPTSADPGRIGGTIALQTGRYLQAEQLFRQAIDREPGGWYAWLGAGLAASALGQRPQATHDFTVAASINSREPAIRQALARVRGAHPLAPDAALRMLVLAQ